MCQTHQTECMLLCGSSVESLSGATSAKSSFLSPMCTSHQRSVHPSALTTTLRLRIHEEDVHLMRAKASVALIRPNLQKLNSIDSNAGNLLFFA